MDPNSITNVRQMVVRPTLGFYSAFAWISFKDGKTVCEGIYPPSYNVLLNSNYSGSRFFLYVSRFSLLLTSLAPSIHLKYEVFALKMIKSKKVLVWTGLTAPNTPLLLRSKNLLRPLHP